MLALILASLLIPQETATIYFFREPKSETIRKYTIQVSCNGVKLGKLQASRYFAVQLPPGRHTCKSTEKSQKPIELDLRAGESKYFEMRTREKFFSFTGYLIPVRQEEGAEIIKTLRPSDKSDIQSALVTIPHNEKRPPK